MNDVFAAAATPYAHFNAGAADAVLVSSSLTQIENTAAATGATADNTSSLDRSIDTLLDQVPRMIRGDRRGRLPAELEALCVVANAFKKTNVSNSQVEVCFFICHHISYVGVKVMLLWSLPRYIYVLLLVFRACAHVVVVHSL